MAFQYCSNASFSSPSELKSLVPSLLPHGLIHQYSVPCGDNIRMVSRTPSPTNFSTPHVSRKDIETIVGMRVKNLEAYQRALVHKSIQKSVRKLNPEQIQPYLLKSNETLEFLGDAVLGLIIAEFLFTKFPTENEGFLTRIRTKLVKGKTLSVFAQKINLGPHILMSKHVINIDGRKNKRILEDAFEAFVGAIFLDLGIEHAKAFILRLVDWYLKEVDIFKDDNYKDLLLRYAQFKQTELPQYETMLQQGPPHQRTFTMGVILFGVTQGVGKAKSKKEAEQIAAKKAIDKLQIVDDFN